VGYGVVDLTVKTGVVTGTVIEGGGTGGVTVRRLPSLSHQNATGQVVLVEALAVDVTTNVPLGGSMTSVV
jgi:hypothetical protein